MHAEMVYSYSKIEGDNLGETCSLVSPIKGSAGGNVPMVQCQQKVAEYAFMKTTGIRPKTTMLPL